MPSFDVVSEVNPHELTNAVDQANRELSTRFDFKGVEAKFVLEDQVTLAARAMILTHMNVGYQDHPLQGRYPSKTAPVVVRRASFIGAGATILAGCTVGPEAFVAACALVNRDVHAGESVRGVPIAARGGAAVT